MNRRRESMKKGMLLVFTLLVSVLIIILIFSLLVSSRFGLRTRNRCSGLSLAEGGVEYGRASMQSGVGKSSSGQLSGYQALYFSDGKEVRFPAGIPNGIGGKQAFGIAVRDKDDTVIGYFAYEMVGVDPVECYSMGLIGASPSKLDRNMMFIVHASLKPYTYSEFTMFLGDPDQTTNIKQATGFEYRDPFYNNVPFRDAIPDAAQYKPGDYILPGGTRSSFNRVFAAGNVNIIPSSKDQEFYGFSLGSYFSPKLDSSKYAKVKVGEGGNGLSVSDTSGLYGVKETEMGLPTSAGKDTTGTWKADEVAEVESVMGVYSSSEAKWKGLKGFAMDGGLYLDGNKFVMSDNTYPGDSAYYNHNNNNANNPYLNKFITSREDPTTTKYCLKSDGTLNTTNCYSMLENGSYVPTADPTDAYQNQEYKLRFYEKQDGANLKGYVEVTNIRRDYGTRQGTQWNIKFNGSDDASYVSTKTYCIQDMKNAVIYVKGNARVFGNVRGKISVVAEGKVTIGNDSTTKDYQADLTYSYLDQTELRKGVVKPLRDASDMIGIITPRKIEIRPYIDRNNAAYKAKVSNYSVCGVMMNLGHPVPKDVQEISRSKFTFQPKIESITNPAKISQSRYVPFYINNLGYKEYNNIAFFGTQIMFLRNSSWKSYFGSSNQIYDDRFLRSQPPYFPTISRGWNIVSWAEVDLSSGTDIRYDEKLKVQ
jgi:hypothetical protein